MLWDISLPFITGEFGIVYKARLTRSILRKTECEIVAVKTIKGKSTASFTNVYPPYPILAVSLQTIKINIVTRLLCAVFHLFCHSNFKHHHTYLCKVHT